MVDVTSVMITGLSNNAVDCHDVQFTMYPPDKEDTVETKVVRREVGSRAIFADDRLCRAVGLVHRRPSSVGRGVTPALLRHQFQEIKNRDKQ